MQTCTREFGYYFLELESCIAWFEPPRPIPIGIGDASTINLPKHLSAVMGTPLWARNSQSTINFSLAVLCLQWILIDNISPLVELSPLVNEGLHLKMHLITSWGTRVVHRATSWLLEQFYFSCLSWALGWLQLSHAVSSVCTIWTSDACSSLFSSLFWHFTSRIHCSAE